MEEEKLNKGILSPKRALANPLRNKKCNGSIEVTKNWSTLSFEPPNICTAISEKIGGGACGFNSLCKHEDEGQIVCQCPQNYTSIDTNDEWKGCKQNFVPQNCDETSPETHHFRFQEG
ncbi:hypothetical protein GBA52_007462, partial [Prunus armeniaca]